MSCIIILYISGEIFSDGLNWKADNKIPTAFDRWVFYHLTHHHAV